MPELTFTQKPGVKYMRKGQLVTLNGQFQTWDLYKRILNNDLMISYEKTFAE